MPNLSRVVGALQRRGLNVMHPVECSHVQYNEKSDVAATLTIPLLYVVPPALNNGWVTPQSIVNRPLLAASWVPSTGHLAALHGPGRTSVHVNFSSITNDTTAEQLHNHWSVLGFGQHTSARFLQMAIRNRTVNDRTNTAPANKAIFRGGACRCIRTDR